MQNMQPAKCPSRLGGFACFATNSMKIPSAIPTMILLVALAGCGASDRNEVARVRGTVTLDGKVYTQGGSVVFQPEAQCKMATGRIQSDGSFEMTTYSAGDGAAVGRHQVIVIPRPAQIVDELAEEKKGATSVSPIPNKYGSASTSGLQYDVKPAESNEFSIELTSK
jgi:hypothetical protein